MSDIVPNAIFEINGTAMRWKDVKQNPTLISLTSTEVAVYWKGPQSQQSWINVCSTWDIEKNNWSIGDQFGGRIQLYSGALMSKSQTDQWKSCKSIYDQLNQYVRYYPGSF